MCDQKETELESNNASIISLMSQFCFDDDSILNCTFCWASSCTESSMFPIWDKRVSKRTTKLNSVGRMFSSGTSEQATSYIESVSASFHENNAPNIVTMNKFSSIQRPMQDLSKEGVKME